MIRLKDTRHASTADFLSAAIGIAEYYGFSHLDALPRVQHDKLQPLPVAQVESDVALARRDERPLLSAARRCLSCTKRGSVALAWRITPSTSALPSTAFELHVVGHSTAIAEALLIVLASAIVEDAGVAGHTLSINNIGSAESSNRYVRDVGVYLRKHIESIAPSLRPRASTDPLGALVQLIERGHPAVPRAPQAMEYLTEEERRRFWDLLEYLEVFGLPYGLDPHILGSRDCWAHSLFELSVTDPESGDSVTIASGGRYDPLMSRFARTPFAAATVSIVCEMRGKARPKRPAVKDDVPPVIYFAHLGVEARRRTLPVLESLRRAGIAAHHGLWHERIGEQMTAARSLATPYVLIMGHKEAMEGTVLVREIATNSQDAVPLPELPVYLKRRHIGALV